jgi:hypothetical protein
MKREIPSRISRRRFLPTRMSAAFFQAIDEAPIAAYTSPQPSEFKI